MKKILWVAVIAVFFLHSSGTVSALSPEQKKVYDSGVRYFDVASCGSSEDTAAEASPAPAITSGGSLYMLGDSIALRSKDLIDSGFSSKGFQPYINASVSRSITGAGTTDGFKTSGLDAAAGDKERIDNSSIVVVSLGTNPKIPASNFESSIKELVDKVKSYDTDSSGIKIYWVNVFSKGGVKASEINKSINKMAASEDFTVIDTIDKNIELDSDNIHPKDPEGTKAFADTVVNGVADAGGASAANPAVGNNCNCGTSSVLPTGSNPQEQVFNFFVTTMGYSSEQAAGATGSLMFESSLVASKPNQAGSGAFGLAQWLGTRLTELKAEEGVDFDKLSNQLKFMKAELEGTTPYKDYVAVNAQMKSASTYQEAQEIWTKNYEGLKNNPEQWYFDDRNKNAFDVLTQYGSNAGGSASGVIACTENDQTSQVTGEYSLPVAKKFYDQHPEWFSKPHHDHAAADIPVSTGTKVFSMTPGTVAAIGPLGSCGNAVFINAGNGVEYGYCHGSDAGSISGVKLVGDKVKAGQLIMHSDNSDFGTPRTSSGPHLHVQIKINGTLYCPQNLFKSIVDGKPLKESDLPTSGCTN